MLKQLFSLYRASFSGLDRSVWLLSFIMFINRTGAMILTFMSLYLTTTRDFSLPEAGLIMGAYGVGSISGAYLGGQWTDRYGYYYIQFFSLVCSALLLILFVFLTSFYAILFTVFAISLVGDTLRPANSVAIAAYTTEDTRTRSYSLMRFAINLGFSIGPALGGIVAGILGFKWIFLIDATTCIIAAILLYIFLPYQKSTEKNEPISDFLRSKSAYKDTKYLLFIFLVTIYAILFFQLITSVPVYWKREWGFSETTIGFLLGLNGLVIVLIEMPVIKVLEGRVNPTKMMALGAFFLVLSFFFFDIGWISLLPAIAFIILMSFSEMFAMPYMMNYAISRPAVDRRGQYMALYSMAYGISHVIAPVSSMYIADHFSFATLYWILTIMSLCLSFAFLWYGKKVE